jgi:hypothetical protein
VGALVARFSTLLMGFAGPPWTLQRLCEVLLEPQKQYKRAHKLVCGVVWCGPHLFFDTTRICPSLCWLACLRSTIPATNHARGMHPPNTLAGAGH